MSPSAATDSSDRPGYWALIAAGEPFRLLFPIGTFLGLLGIALWPLFVWGGLPVYPGFLHARIMIEGFVTTFIVGFLGTALPRLLDTPRFTLRESLLFAVLLLGGAVLHLTFHTLAGDGLYLFTLLCFGTALVRRVRVRKDNPPPAFLLVAGGLLSALVGVSLQILAQIPQVACPGWLVALGRLLLTQSFVLLPVLGVGAFLLPRFFGLPNRQSLPESLELSPEWKRRAAAALACALLLIGSFVLEAFAFFRAAYALRALVIAVYLLREVPLHKAFSIPGSLAIGLRVALFSLPIGYALMAVFPDHALSFLHVVFISGFSLLIFIVGSRVIYGHSGQPEKFQALLFPVIVLFILLPLAMLTRVGADWLPAVRFDHYAYAAIAWILGVGLWAVTVLPGVGREL